MFGVVAQRARLDLDTLGDSLNEHQNGSNGKTLFQVWRDERRQIFGTSVHGKFASRTRQDAVDFYLGARHTKRTWHGHFTHRHECASEELRR